MPRNPTPPILATVRAQTPDDAGLAAMFGPVAGDERIVQIALHALDDNPYQHRSAGYADDDASLIELSTDIAANGIHQPLIVRPHPDQDREPGRYQIAAGHRRRKAAHLASLETVPCVVRDLTDDAMLDVVFAENYHRTDINPIDRAQLMALLAERGLTHQQIADRFSLSRPAVSNAIRLLKLPQVIQQDIAAGKISNRQAEAILPLASLPPEVQHKLGPHNNLQSVLERAQRGDSSDSLRARVTSAVTYATQELPEHWRNHTFSDLDGIQQPNCTGCPRMIRHADGDRCTLPACWAAKSSAWQAIENRQIVELTGTAIIAEDATYGERTFFYSGQLKALGLSETADAPPAHTCPNLRVKQGYKGKREWICHHPGKKSCACVDKAEKAQIKDGRAAWKELRTQVNSLLAARLALFDIDALRLLAIEYGKWEQREQVHAWGAEQCIPVIVAGLIKFYTPYDAEKNTDTARAQMQKLLRTAGLRAPWLPPLEDELHNTLAHIRRELDDFIDPGDGLPTMERMAAILDQLNAALDSAMANLAGDAQAGVVKRYHNIWPDALALNERVQASHAEAG